MLIGYARVSTLDQDPALQLDALKAVGCERLYEEKASGAKEDRPELAKALDHLRKDDVLVVWKLDRLARSLKQLVLLLEDLGQRGISTRSPDAGAASVLSAIRGFQVDARTSSTRRRA